jgi:chemotaxis protein CheD
LLIDEQAGVSGMIHIMLPEAFKDKPVDKVGKFADTGIPAMIAQMEDLGANKSRMIAAYAGGAQVFKFGAEAASRLDVGARNGDAVATILKKLAIRVVAHDIGGSSGRTVIFSVAEGTFRVRTVQGGENVLCTFRRAMREAA